MATFRLRDWFFQITQTATQRGTRFRNGDRPPQATFEDLFKSVVFRTEATYRAKEDTGSFSADNNGHVTVATGDQVKSYTAQPVDRTLSVGPDQVTEVVTGQEQTIGDFTGQLASVVKDTSNKRRNVFQVLFGTGFVGFFNTWYAEVNNRLLPPGGTTGQVLKKTSDTDYDATWQDDDKCDCVTGFELKLQEGIPDDADVIVIYDTSSFTTVTSRVPAQDLATSWYNSYTNANPNFGGKLVEIEDSTEDWVIFPQKYHTGLYPNAARITNPDGTSTGTGSVSGGAVGNTVPIGTPNSKFVVLVFIDESSSQYHSSGEGGANAAPTASFITDYSTFTTEHPNFEFFQGIVYPAQGTQGLDAAGGFHAHLTKALTEGTLAVSPGLTITQTNAGWAGTAMDFMTSVNPYTASAVDGLENFGWLSSQYDLSTPAIGSITQTEFNNQVNSALQGSAGSKTITITGCLTFESGATLESTIQFDVAPPS